MINSYLQSESDLDDRAIHLLFSANRWELAYVHNQWVIWRILYLVFLTLNCSASIEQTLSDGITVLCDRYAFSGIAFSASKGLSYKWCRSPDIYLPAPDVTLFLDITPEKAKERGGYGEERYEKEDIQVRVREVFRRIGKEMIDDGGNWIEIDAGRERETVSESLWTLVEPLSKGVEGTVQRLWSEEGQ
ncbi:thymidylate kinase-domain-containing protein [Collybia nuda]|uniref:dTMP kinase n=1 Tax=Collybia nuda TaxID=64659 RepID=A0A9P6CI30_9AGAR|nr:thymidylate kinase-domain-containing protein [Collybia nuda]